MTLSAYCAYVNLGKLMCSWHEQRFSSFHLGSLNRLTRGQPKFIIYNVKSLESSEPVKWPISRNLKHYKKYFFRSKIS
jgi:hypothetical protein